MAKKKPTTIQERLKAVSNLEKAKTVNFTTHPHLRKSVGNSLEYSNSIDLSKIKHPWQPDWVRTGEDMNTFLKLLDEHKHLSKREEDWYPPFFYIVDNTDGEERLSCFPSAWNGNYDPVEHGIENPLNVIEKFLNKGE